MRYKRFTIENYRAISGPLEVRVDSDSLTPIIGVNESGKTTVLHALFAFDSFNDLLNDDGRHLKDTRNLYSTSSDPATITADIELTTSELKKVFSACARSHPELKEIFEDLSRRRRLPNKLTVARDIPTKKYSILSEHFGNQAIQDALVSKLLSYLPYILYFDDFRDKIPERIDIPLKKEDTSSDWLDMIEQLFNQTDANFSVFKLAEMEERQRRTVLAKVQRRLNEALTRQWQAFRLDDRDALKIGIQFKPDGPPPVKSYINLDVVETDEAGNDHFFFISDRSKGFYWFFNFVMKLEFNPKLSAGSDHSIYLLDEPGSYLHAYAQRKLCSKLRHLSDKNRVIYCTHSHYLLDPEIINVGSIFVADKDGNGKINLTRMIDYSGSIDEKRSALQPVLDALQIKPYILDLIHTQLTVITEGIYDYYALELFRNDRAISILPGVGAESIKFYVSLMVCFQVTFRALWDADKEGKKKHAEASDIFGSHIASTNFRLLPSKLDGGRRIMQDLFNGGDLLRIRQELGIADNCSFERTILALFYSPQRKALMESFSSETKQNFEAQYLHLT